MHVNSLSVVTLPLASALYSDWKKHHIMSSSHGNLVALNRRLQMINQHMTNQDHPMKLEDSEIHPSKPKYICAECAWTTSAGADALARHFTVKHTTCVKCRDCKVLCEDQGELRKHRLEKHRHLCLGCRRFFATVNRCQHHEPCEREQRVGLISVDGVSTHTTISQPIGGKTPGGGQSILNKRGSVQSNSCPDPGCQLTFLDFDTMYEHYVGTHSLSIVYRDHPKPFKCPFCSKRYQHDRFIPGHVRTHKPRFLDGPGIGDAEDQKALIRESHVAMANREPELRAQAQAQADHTSSDEEGECTIPIKEEEEEEEEYALVLKDSVLYIEEGAEPLNPLPGQPDQPDEQETQRFNGTTPIGLVLQAQPADLPNALPTHGTPVVEAAPRAPTVKPELSDSMDLDDDYPERFALDDDELPSRTSNLDSSIIAAQLVDGIFHQSLSRMIVCALQMQHFINVSEVVDLFTYFLDEHQRIYVLEQLASININQQDSIILEALHSTVFKALIDAWVDFKRLAIRFAPQLIIQANNQRVGSGKSVTWALLHYCLNLENTIYRNDINIAHHFLRDPPLDDFVVTTDAPFSRLVAALAERVKNKLVHDSAIVFTNEMILREMRDYVRILQMVFRPLYPLAAGHERLWRELRLL